MYRLGFNPNTLSEDKRAHLIAIGKFANYLFSRTSDYVLKGGTSLMLCYRLTRYSEDIYLDALVRNPRLDILSALQLFCDESNYTLRIVKNTDVVKRGFIHYDKDKPLKIEVSFRRVDSVPENAYTWIDGIQVYHLYELFRQKLTAYSSRGKLRDLYDVLFIIARYKAFISDEYVGHMREQFSYKGLDYIEYLVKTQTDPLIDSDALLSAALQVFCDYNIE